MTDLAVGHMFLSMLACTPLLQFVCCWQWRNFTASKHFQLQVLLCCNP